MMTQDGEAEDAMSASSVWWFLPALAALVVAFLGAGVRVLRNTTERPASARCNCRVAVGCRSIGPHPKIDTFLFQFVG
jgi:hypothetical protein